MAEEEQRSEGGDDGQADVLTPADYERYVAEQNEHSARLGEATLRVIEHPYHELKFHSDNIRISLAEIVMPNHAELVGLLSTAPWDQRPVNDYMESVHRSLHNYVASVYSLRKHVETIFDRRAKVIPEDEDPLRAAWKAKKAELAEEPENFFVFDLRTYIQHYAIAPIGHSTRGGQVDGVLRLTATEVIVSTKAMRRLHGLNTKTKAMLAGRDDIDLQPIVVAHGPMVYELNSWFANALVKESAPLIDEYNELQAQYNAVLMGVTIEQAREAMALRTRARMP